MFESEKEAEAALRASLPLGSVTLRKRGEGDFDASLPDGSRRRLHLVWAGYGYPRDVQRALRDDRTLDARSNDDLVVVAAHQLSDGARQLLRSAGLSWIGLDGSAELRLGTVWVDRNGDGRHRRFRAEIGWSGARSEVAEALIAILEQRDPELPGANEVPEVEALANLSGRSLGTVANTLAMFDRSGWTARGKHSRSRVVANAPALLDSWATWIGSQHRRFDGFHSIHREPMRIIDDLGAAFGSSLILTGPAASEEARPFLTGSWVVTAYVDTPDGWSGIDRGTRTAKMIPAAVPRIRLAPASPVIVNTRGPGERSSVASGGRIYADLLVGSEREREAAEAFRSTALRPFS